MTGESDIAWFARQGCFGDVADGAAQNGVRGTLHDDNFEVKTTNLDLTDHAALHKGRRRSLAGTYIFELRLFVGLIGVRVQDDVAGIAQGEDAERQKKVGRRAEDCGVASPGPNCSPAGWFHDASLPECRGGWLGSTA